MKRNLTRLALLFFFRISGGLLTVITQYFITHKMSLRDVGIVNLYLSVFMFFLATGNFGISKAMLKVASENIAEKNNSFKVIKSLGFRRAITYSILISLIFIFIYIFNSKIYRLGESDLILGLILVFPFSLLVYILADIFKGLGKHFLSIIFWNFAFGIALAIYTMIAETISFIGLASVYGGVSIVLLIYAKEHLDFKSVEFRSYPEKVLAFNLSQRDFGITMLVEEAIRWLPLMAIGFMSYEDGALYSVAMRIAVIFSVMLQVLNIFAPSIVARLYHSGDIISLRKLLRQMSFLMLFIGGGMILIVFLYGDYILGFFGREYETSHYVLIVLTLSAVANGAFGPVDITLQTIGFEAKVKNTSMVALAILIIGILLFASKGLLLLAGVVFITTIYRSIYLALSLNKVLTV